MLFSTEGTLQERCEDVEKMFGDEVNVRRVIDFINASSDRSLCVPR
jgi:UDP-N-acetylglucosamine acyltransferase